MQIKFTTRSGSNRFAGSALPLLPERQAELEHLLQQGARAAEGPTHAEPARHSGGGPVVIPGAVRRPRQAVLLRQLRGDPARRTRSRPNSSCCCPTRRTASSGTPAAGRRRQPYALAAANGQIATPDPTVAELLQRHPQLDGEQRRHAISEITGNLNAERYYVPAADRRGRPLPDRPHGLQRHARLTALSGTWYRQRFIDSRSTRPTRDSRPGRDSRSTACRARFARRYTGVAAFDAAARTWSTRRASAYRARRSTSRRTSTRDMYNGPLANQGGYHLGISAGAASPTPARRHASARDADDVHVHRTR